MVSTQPEIYPSAASIATRATATVKMTVPLFVLYAAWVLAVMEPDWLLTSTIGGPFYRLPTLILPVLIAVVVIEGKASALSWPFLIFLLLHMGASLFAENAGFARTPMKFILHMFMLYTATITLIDTLPKAAILLKIYLAAFFWYGIQGIPGGLVSWHPLLANEDSYGPLMGIAFGFSYYFALAIESKFWKRFSTLLCAIAMVGVVAANARGAVISAVIAIAMVWIRSPNKFKTLAAGIVASVIGVIAAGILFPDGAFWSEVSSISNSADEGTGQQRLVMWKMAWPVFLTSPIFGVGVSNFGVIASTVIPFDPTRTQFQDPARLYAAMLHNIYVRIFCEEGIIGVVAFLAMLTTYAKQILLLRSKRVVQAWERVNGPGWDPAHLSRALEIAMIAFLANGVFYNQMYIHWFWTLLAITGCLAAVARKSVREARMLGARPHIAGPPSTQAPPASPASSTGARSPRPNQQPNGSLAGGLLSSRSPDRESKT